MIKINKINMEVENVKENIKQTEKIERKTKIKCVAKRTEISKPMDMSKRKNRKRKSGE